MAVTRRFYTFEEGKAPAGEGWTKHVVEGQPTTYSRLEAHFTVGERIKGLFSGLERMRQDADREVARTGKPINPNARDLHNVGYIRPDEVEIIIKDGKEVERVKSAVTVSQAYQGVVDRAEAAAKAGRGIKALKIAGGIVAAGAALAGLNWLSKRGKTSENQDVAVDVAPPPQAVFVDGPADEKPGNYWQSTVRGNGPQNAASIPKMNVVPAEMVQDLGAAPMVRK